MTDARSGGGVGRTRDARVEALLASRPSVAREVEHVRSARSASIDGARSVARRIRPSGNIVSELRAHPLRAVGLLIALSLLGVRWLTGRGSADGRDASESGSNRSGIAGSFAAGLAAAAAERGGRAVIDALLDSQQSSARTRSAVDETARSTEDE